MEEEDFAEKREREGVFIKRVVVEGFRSYNNKVIFNPLSDGLNTIIGLNGSGKSNLYRAVEFVLLDEFSDGNKRSYREKESILHEGRGEKAKEAKVEVVLSNKGRQMPIDKDEVSIERRISLKKDEFFVCGKKWARNEVSNLLETAGFSPSSPYYVVRQGNVSRLAMMSEENRFDVICDVAGTKFYDKQKEESEAMIKETAEKRAKIKESINFMSEKLNDLGGEKEELENFLTIEKEIQNIEFSLKHRKLLSLEEKVNDNNRTLEESFNAMSEEKKTLDELTTKKEENEASCALLDTRKKELINERNKKLPEKEELIKKHTSNTSRSEEINIKMQATENKKADLEERIKEADKKIEEKKKEVQNKRENVANISNELNSIEKKLGYKKGSNSDGKTIETLEMELRLIQQSLPQFAEYSSSYMQRDRELEERMNILNEEEENYRQTQNINNSHMNDLVKQEMEISAAITQTNKMIEEIRNTKDELQSKIKNEVKKLEERIPTQTLFGVKAAERIANDKGISEYIGTVSSIISCNEKYVKAVEAASKNKLHHIVIETSAAAKVIINSLIEQKAGRVTFIPLDTVKKKHMTAIGQQNIIQYIKFDPKYKAAIEYVFGSICIADNLNDARNISKTYKSDCVTIDGDIVCTSGSVSGGSTSNPFNKQAQTPTLEIQSNIKKMKEELEEKEQLLEEASRELNGHKNHIKRVQNEITELKNQQKALNDQILYTEEKIQSTTSEISSNKLSLQLSNDKQSEAEQQMNQLINKIESMRNTSTSKTKRVPNEKALLSKMESLSDKVKEEESNIANISQEITTTLIPLRNRLNDDLSKVEQEIRIIKTDAEEAAMNEKVSSIKLSEFEEGISSLEQNIEKLEQEISTKEEESSYLANDIEQRTSRYDELSTTYTKLSTVTETLLKEKKEVEEAMNEQMIDAQDERFSTLSENELARILQSKHNDMKKYEYVNKLAKQQFTQISNELESLHKRDNLLEENESSIKEIITTLDSRKEAAIKATFDKVAENFAEIFTKLTRTGEGELQMFSNQGNNNGRVSINIKFEGMKEIGEERESLSVNQLSGGQKSVVALALVFAIQKTSPAPFYLMDEVDAALDPVYRESLSKLIKESSKEAQYIVTTFKPELIQKSDAVFILSFANNQTDAKQATNEEGEALINSAQ